jgi:DNA-binding transcriptional ArsR family regulator
MKLSDVEKVSKALADETRLRIFQAISAAGQMTCSQIVSMRGVTPATVSHHLKILNEAGLISCQRKGQFVYSQAVPQVLRAYMRALGKMATAKRKPRRKLVPTSEARARIGTNRTSRTALPIEP